MQTQKSAVKKAIRCAFPHTVPIFAYMLLVQLVFQE